VGLRTLSPVLLTCERRSADPPRPVRGCQAAVEITTRRDSNGVFDCCRATAGIKVVRATRVAWPFYRATVSSSRPIPERALVGLYISYGAPHVACAEAGGSSCTTIVMVSRSEVVAFPLASAASLAVDMLVAQVDAVLEEADEGRLLSTQEVTVWRRMERFEAGAEQRPAPKSPCSPRRRCNRREQMLPKRAEDQGETTRQYLWQVIACCSTRASFRALPFASSHISPGQGVETHVR
jgi:hypothetical protein